MADVHEDLARIGEAVKGRFEAQKRVLSFDEYLQLCVQHPARHSRDAARYLRDMFDHYGTYDVDRPWGQVTRFRLFDLPFDAQEELGQPRRRDHLVGQEVLQSRFYRIVSNFVREGRANRLILLHGPNGSSKTTFLRAVMRGLEDYSTVDEGALYRFSWIFPRGKDGKTIGFDSASLAAPGKSCAHLPDSQIDVKMPSEVREHPLLLLPETERRGLLQRVLAESPEPPPDWLWSGQLSHKNQQIFQALLTAYRGELRRVLNHVQVERYYISRRYRLGAVTIGPQMAVDAGERQITADQSLQALPASLSSLTLYEPYGELVDASGGLVEYSDLLKRPLDAWKYLLLAIETGDVPLPLSNLQVNAVLAASSNEIHLAAFREHHEYGSFLGRLELVRVPYLLDYEQERSIYEAQIVPQVRRFVAPHAIWAAALWAVLTRLQRSVPDRYERSALGRLAADLTPLEKADLYAKGRVPQRFGSDDLRELKSGVEAIFRESTNLPEYEGLTGASPREIRTILLEAANDASFDCLSPLAVLERIEAFCQRSDYDFLKQSPDRGYGDHRGFVRLIRERWLDLVDDELRVSTGLIDETQYRDLFDQYVTHVSYWVKNERVYNEVTGKYEDPDADLMRNVEDRLEVDGSREEFRRNLISVVAAHAIDHPGEHVDRAQLFPRYIDKLREAYFRERSKQIGSIARDMLVVLDEGPGLDSERQELAEATLGRMLETRGYDRTSVRVAMGELVKERYSS